MGKSGRACGTELYERNGRQRIQAERHGSAVEVHTRAYNLLGQAGERAWPEEPLHSAVAVTGKCVLAGSGLQVISKNVLRVTGYKLEVRDKTGAIARGAAPVGKQGGSCG